MGPTCRKNMDGHGSRCERRKLKGMEHAVGEES